MLRSTSTLLAAALAATSAMALPTDLPLTSITLYASGVGHHRHLGPVPAGAEVTLSLTAEELNDALKSLTVGSAGGAGGVSVAYPGQAGIEERLAAFGVDVRGVDSRFALLGRLRGVPIEVTLGDGSTRSGRVLAVEERPVRIDEDAEATRRTLTLVSDSGLEDIDLDRVGGLKINDERLAGELQAAMELLAGQRDTRRKPLTITFENASPQARVSYLAAAPLWKLSYRLDLSGEAPRLQGWAIIDNTSDRDWKNVRVTLVSGRPASFVQDLYTPEYLERPVVRPERFAGLVPVEHAQAAGAPMHLAARSRKNQPFRNRLEADEMPMVMSSMEAADAFGDFGDELSPAANAADLGELFAYDLSAPVTLDRGASAMLPILDDVIEAERVSIFNSQVLGAHPMRGVRLTNTSALKLDAGPVTVLDGDQNGAAAYAGDARLGFTAPGDERLLTYAIDLEVTATTDQDTESTRVGASFERGVLVWKIRDVHEHVLGFRNASGEARSLLVEVPRFADHQLVDPPEGVEKTTDLYRVPVVADAGGEVTVRVAQVRTRAEHVSLVNLNDTQLVRLTQGGGLDAESRKKLENAASLRRALTQAERGLAELDAERDRIGQEQARIRENLEPLDRDSALRQRYVSMLDSQEDRLAELIDERRQAVAEVQKRRAAFEALVQGF